MQQTLRVACAFVLFSTVAVLASGGLLLRSFAGKALVDCRGGLRTIPVAEVADRRSRVDGASDLEIRYDEARPSTYSNVRVEWARPDAGGACSDAPIPWREAAAAGVVSPVDLPIQRDDVTGAYVVVRPAALGGRDLTAFRRINARGHRFVVEQLEGHGVGLLVFVVALAALAMAGWRLWRAWPYATRIRTWQAGHLRSGGRVEDENQTVVGRLEMETENAVADAVADAQHAGSDILVDPLVIDPSNGYREARVLGPRDVRVGSHALWTAATTKRLREACMLAMLAMLATGVAAATIVTRSAI